MIGFHLRALRYRSTLWQNHLEAVSQFLSAWPTREHLVLIGPSGGYSIPSLWLERFAQISVVEPDPIGRVIFERRNESVRNRLQFFTQPLNFSRPDFLLPWPTETTSVLFANVLGQVAVSKRAPMGRSIRSAIQGRSWASFHDRFSASEVLWNTPHGWSDSRLSTEGLAFSQPKFETNRSRAPAPTIQEHLASEWFLGSAVQSALYWDWQIAPKQVHLIEGLIGRN